MPFRSGCSCRTVDWYGSRKLITSVVGGASYKYSLLFVIDFISHYAMQLQQMAGKLWYYNPDGPAQKRPHHSPKWLAIVYGDFRISLDGDRSGRSSKVQRLLNLLFKIPIMIASS